MMNQAAAALVAEFADGARIAQAAEQELRRRMADEIAKLERQRAFAFRRTRLVQALASVVAVEAEEAEAEQRRAVTNEIGWSGESEIEKTILDRLQPVGRAVLKCTCGSEQATSADVYDQLDAFEIWYEQTYGKPFYALFDVYVAEAPVVDF
jgi:hypothetical protein